MIGWLSEQFIALYTPPFYAFIIFFEVFLSFFHEKKYYRLKDSMTNIYLSVVYLMLDLLVRGIGLSMLGFTYGFHFLQIQNLYLYWFLLFICQDFLYWVMHYLDHKIRIFWAAHVTHHSSEEFNLTVGLRSSVLQPFYKFLYFIPLAFMGFKAIDIMLMYALTQGYGIIVHTRFIKKLGFIEWIFTTPSHHRVHHSKNIKYLDKNMGMVLIIWDRLFGTFQEEDDENETSYGLTNKPNNSGLISVFMHEVFDIYYDLRRKDIGWKEKIWYVVGPPGWSHDNSRKTTKQLREEYFKELETKKEKKNLVPEMENV
jgi:sterol desaturase/sphingolipid hydroxylase (fatty acid hydroxylase superfamily)